MSQTSRAMLAAHTKLVVKTPTELYHLLSDYLVYQGSRYRYRSSGRPRVLLTRIEAITANQVLNERFLRRHQEANEAERERREYLETIAKIANKIGDL